MLRHNRSTNGLTGSVLSPAGVLIAILATTCAAGNHHHGASNGNHLGKQRSRIAGYQQSRRERPHWRKQESPLSAANVAHGHAWTHNTANAGEGYREHALFGEHHGATHLAFQEPSAEAAETMMDEGINHRDGWKESDVEGIPAADEVGALSFSKVPMTEKAFSADPALDSEWKIEQHEAVAAAAEPVDSDDEVEGGAATDGIFIPEKERKAFELGTKGFSWPKAVENHWRDGQAALKAFPPPPTQEEEEEEEGTEVQAEGEVLEAPELVKGFRPPTSLPQEPEEEAALPVDSNDELQGGAIDTDFIPEKERKAFELGTKGFSWPKAVETHWRDGQAALKAFPPPPTQEEDEEKEGEKVEGSEVMNKGYLYPQVYIYGLEQSCFSSGGSSIERTFPLQLRKTGHYQPDISKADLFLVPAQPSCHRPSATASSTAADYIKRVLEEEVRPLGAWDRPGGPRRHLWVFSSDHGFCGFEGQGLVGIPEIKDSVILSPWGLKDIEHDVNMRNETDQRPRPTGPGALPCHVPGKDVVIPPDLGITEVPGGCAAPGPRGTQLLFIGNSGLNSALGYSHGVRQMVFLMFGDQQHYPMYRITESSGGSYEDMQHAKFCLAPTGSGWGEHLYHIMQRGCIPVIVQDGVAQPWEDERLDYTKFAVVVQQYKLHRLPMILNASEERPGLLEDMRQEVCRVAPLFAWEWNGSNGTAMEATMDLLAARLRSAEQEAEQAGRGHRRLLGLRRA